MDYKYIKRVNWPWVEIVDFFTGPVGETMIINIADVAAVWSRTDSKYRSGIKLKNGDWLEMFCVNAIKELKDLIMKHDKNVV